MLFNSLPFLLVFLPLSLLLYFLLGQRSGVLAKTALALLSFVFYAYWDYHYLPLLFGSICLNFYLGGYIAANQANAKATARRFTIIGISINLVLLAFFKYANLLTATAHSLLDLPLLAPHIVLPIGISFFTFTQIAYLVDAYQGKTQESRFWDYALFVSYFPHQIAGPILHHKEMMSQFRLVDRQARWSTELLTVGLSILACGLIKKVLLADSFADIATPVFNAAENGLHITFFEAWAGVTAYALQLYFDFSAYCDMAIGVSLMFGIRLPANFNSPYKSTSIIEFWQRWHITLSRFLRDYLYIPLGGNRNGAFSRYRNLMITMALGGLWHGASWTFLVWGVLHGTYLIINHLWRAQVKVRSTGLLWRSTSWALTFAAVLLAWVFFRAPTFHGALAMLSSMIGQHGVVLPESAQKLAAVLPMLSFGGHWLGSVQGGGALAMIAFGVLICVGLPNTQQLFASHQPVLPEHGAAAASVAPAVNGLERALLWRPTLLWCLPLALATGLAISRLGNDSQFLYFNF
jgi:D-alanyl-lipoteichoic acid acyltransferase DltB (MBOAT superfamily)